MSAVELPGAQQSSGHEKAADSKGQCTSATNHNAGSNEATMVFSRLMLDWTLLGTIGSIINCWLPICLRGPANTLQFHQIIGPRIFRLVFTTYSNVPCSAHNALARK